MYFDEFLKKKNMQWHKLNPIFVEIEITMALIAKDNNSNSLLNSIKEKLPGIIGFPLIDEEMREINDESFEKFNFDCYNSIKKYGIEDIEQKDKALSYIKILWFFSYIGLNYKDQQLKTTLYNNISYFDIQEHNQNNILNQINYRYNHPKSNPKNLNNIGKMINDKYLDSLLDVLNESIDKFIEANKDLMSIRQIYGLERKKKIVKAKAKTNITENPKKECNSVSDFESRIDNIVDSLKEEVKKETNELKAKYEQMKKERNAENQKYLNIKENLEKEKQKASNEGQENLIKKMNDEDYGFIIDKLYEIAKSNKEFPSFEIKELAGKFISVLESLGYKFDKKDLNNELTSEKYKEEFKKYRCSNYEDINNSNVVIAYPGLKRNNVIVYQPRIIKK